MADNKSGIFVDEWGNVFEGRHARLIEALFDASLELGMDIDWETRRLVPPPSRWEKHQWWLEGDQDTPDYYKFEED